MVGTARGAARSVRWNGTRPTKSVVSFYEKIYYGRGGGVDRNRGTGVNLAAVVAVAVAFKLLSVSQSNLALQLESR
jgi:hypothetical protein